MPVSWTANDDVYCNCQAVKTSISILLIVRVYEQFTCMRSRSGYNHPMTYRLVAIIHLESWLLGYPFGPYQVLAIYVDF
jgi:hypothetical protein